VRPGDAVNIIAERDVRHLTLDATLDYVYEVSRGGRPFRVTVQHAQDRNNTASAGAASVKGANTNEQQLSGSEDRNDALTTGEATNLTQSNESRNGDGRHGAPAKSFDVSEDVRTAPCISGRVFRWSPPHAG
jgi:hypothetical protein